MKEQNLKDFFLLVLKIAWARQLGKLQKVFKKIKITDNTTHPNITSKHFGGVILSVSLANTQIHIEN